MEQIDHAIVARGFPSMYTMHKYWGRKPPNVIAEYIKHYTAENDIVLDPFSGSGVTTIEAVRLERKAIAIDLNPMAIFITRMTLEPVDLVKFESVFQDLKNQVQVQIDELHTTRCTKCGRTGTIQYTEWLRDKGSPARPIRIVYSCRCSRKWLIKGLDSKDFAAIKKIRKRQSSLWFPKDIAIPPFRREKFKYLHELFTHRNLICLSILINAINRITDSKMRQMMEFVFTSSLAQSSKLKMVTQNKTGDRASKGWIAPRFYVPRHNLEVNPWKNFETRFRTVLRGKKMSNKELIAYREAKSLDDLVRGDKNALLLLASASRLPDIPDESVDYIFTDPPAGSDIQYMSLSAFWGAWLGFRFDFDNEITINPYQGKDCQKYHEMLATSFGRMNKLLKPGRYMHVSFHSTKKERWDLLLRTIVGQNFELQKIVYQPPRYSFSPAIRTGGPFIGDYILRFRKPVKARSYPRLRRTGEVKYEEKVVSKAEEIIALRGEPTPLVNILTGVYEALASSEILLGKKKGIELILKDHLGKEFVLKAAEKDQDIRWWLRNTHGLSTKPLRERLAEEIANSLSSETEANRFDLLQRILRKLKGPLTPNIEDITHFLRNCATHGEDLPAWRDRIAKFKQTIPIYKKQHVEFMYFLAKHGIEEGFGVWLDSSMQEEVYSEEQLGSLCAVDAFRQLSISRDERRRLATCDVLWLKAGKIVCQFEIECDINISDTTVKRSSVLRKADKIQRVFVIPRRLRRSYQCDAFRRSWGEWGLVFYDELIDYLQKHTRNIDKGLLARAREKYGQPPREEVQKIIHTKAPVISHSRVKGAYHKIVLSIPEIERVEPGQFLYILCDNDHRRNMWFVSQETVKPGKLPRIRGIEIMQARPLLRRPFSVHRIYYEGFDRKDLARDDPLPQGFRRLIHRPHPLIDILYKRVGTGTNFLARTRKGQSLDIVGPLGRGYFRIRRDKKVAVLVAGGVGIAPLMALAEKLRYENIEVVALVGAISRDNIPLDNIVDSTVPYSFADMELDYFLREFSEIGVKAAVATEDGSLGRKGKVTDLFEQLVRSGSINPKEAVAYSCGPKPMLKAIARLAGSYHLPCQVLLEQRMGCGIGACLSCAIKVKTGRQAATEFKRVCIDGPVFDAEKVEWS